MILMVMVMMEVCGDEGDDNGLMMVLALWADGRVALGTA